MKIKLSLWGCLPGLSFNILSTKSVVLLGKERSVKTVRIRIQSGLNAAKPVLGVSDKAKLKPVYSARETS